MTWTKRDDETERERMRERLRAPAWCPVCEVVMKNGSGGDDKTYYKWGCCRYCFIEFVEHREERWQSGWRPDADAVTRMFEKMRG